MSTPRVVYSIVANGQVGSYSFLATNNVTAALPPATDYPTASLVHVTNGTLETPA